MRLTPTQAKVLQQIRNRELPSRMNEQLRRIVEGMQFNKLVIASGDLIKNPEAKVEMTPLGERALDNLLEKRGKEGLKTNIEKLTYRQL